MLKVDRKNGLDWGVIDEPRGMVQDELVGGGCRVDEGAAGEGWEMEVEEQGHQAP